MIALYLLAAHMLGDFVLSDRWQAARKLDDAGVRTAHVAAYCLPFIPLAAYAAPTRNAVAFLGGLYVLHFLTDSRRARSTFGDWLRWQTMTPQQRADELEEISVRHIDLPDNRLMSGPHVVRWRLSLKAAAVAPVPPNPWAPIPILIDQTLHLCQLALLGGLLLR